MKKIKKISTILLVSVLTLGLVGCGKMSNDKIVKSLEEVEAWTSKEDLKEIASEIKKDVENYDNRIWTSNTVLTKFNSENVFNFEEKENKFIEDTVSKIDNTVEDEKTKNDAKEALYYVAKNKYYIDKAKELNEEVSKQVEIPVGNFSQPKVSKVFDQYKATNMYFFLMQIGKDINKDNMFYDDMKEIINKKMLEEFDNEKINDLYVKSVMGVLKDIIYVKESVQLESLKLFNNKFILWLQDLGVDEYRKTHDEIVNINSVMNKTNDLYIFKDILRILKNYNKETA